MISATTASDAALEIVVKLLHGTDIDKFQRALNYGHEHLIAQNASCGSLVITAS